jgi:hypothetical protein
MATNYPPSPGYVTLDALEKAIQGIKNSSAHTHPPQLPQARIVLDQNGETLELGNWKINASSTHAENQLVITSVRTGKTAIIITEDKIIIGNPNKDHLEFEL